MNRCVTTGIVLLMAGLLQACVQPTRDVSVTFEVDVRNQEDVQQVSVRGGLAPLSWQENAPLSDADGDSIYTGTFTFNIPYDSVPVKFVINENQFELDGKPNRMAPLKENEPALFRVVFDEE